MPKKKPKKEMKKISDIRKRITCGTCSHFSCCKEIGTPFFVTPREIQKIKKRTNLPEEHFALKQKINGKELYFLQKKGNYCIFFNPKGKKYKKCTIYALRPLDCRLFPLDFYKKNGKFVWLKYNFCDGNGEETEKMIEKAESRVIPFFKELSCEYAELEMELFEKGDWKEVRKVIIKEK